MIIFRAVESGRWFDLGHDRLRKTATLVQADLRFFRRCALFGRMVENHGTILITNIGSLTIQRGRIMIRPEDIKELIVTNDRWIELHLHNFSMPGVVSAHIFVGWIFRRATRVSNGGVRHALYSPEGRFHPPKTTGPKCCFFCRHVPTMKREG